MAGRYAGKHVFVAGASSGINLAIAHGFAAEGAKVTVLSRSADKIEAAAAGIRETGAEAIGIACDVRDYPGLEAAYAEATGKFGPIDVLISGAAGNFLAPAVKLSANAFKTVDMKATFDAHAAELFALAFRFLGAHAELTSNGKRTSPSRTARSFSEARSDPEPGSE